MKRTLRLLLLLLLPGTFANAQLTSVGDGGPGPFKALHLTAELVSLAPAVAPGGTVTVGLVISPEEKWHVYWLNAGDSGEPPAIKWTLPPGVTAGPLQFPIPSRLPLGPLMDFGYDDNTAFPVKISVAAGTKPGPIHLDAMVTWLVCREVCVPGKAHMGITLTVAPNAAPGQALGTLGEAVKALPTALPAGAKLSILGAKTEFVITILNGPAVKPDDVEFYPNDPDLIINAADQDVERVPNGYRIRILRAEDPAKAGAYPPLPATLNGVLKVDDNEGFEIAGTVVPGELPDSEARAATIAASTEANSAVAQATGSATPVALPQQSASTLTALPAIGLAFLGGIILNLMPCVFPVLFLKGLALVQSSGEERGKMRAHGLVYTLGIVVSFWVIVAVLLVLRSTGSRIGWGFQLQSPAFIAILASFLFLFALSLAGQFDIGLSLTSAGGELAKKEGYTGTFFTGVLATVVATPCTAPLMGAAIGFALGQPAYITFAVFTALALGLALPYFLLTLQPAWTRFLPRPGAWMETFKHITALIFFITVIWLAWVYGRLHAGGNVGAESDNLAYLLLCFAVLAVAGWVLGRWPAKWSSAIAATVLILGALAIPLSHPRVIIVSSSTTAASEATSEPTLTWQPYSQTALTAARAAGHPVFIDFTAAWCLSCQVNEKLILRSPEIEHQFAAHQFTLLRADWTQEDPAITAALAAISRSGVPTYVVYPATGNADVLPELLSEPLVLTAIQVNSK